MHARNQCCPPDPFNTHWWYVMSWLGIALVVIGIIIAIKVVGFMVRIGMVLLIVAGLYLVFGPMLGH
jgi:dolichyl-phosphate-mannose--protein O-mannosyl transferase